jgi:hypothetical protein
MAATETKRSRRSLAPEQAKGIADPLKVFFPNIEKDSKGTIDAYRSLRDIRSRYHCAITGIHHIRKPVDQNRVWLDKHSLGDWFLQARGPRELINGCDVRIGVDRPYGYVGDDQLVIRGFRRVDGEFPMERIARVLDGDGEPQGFRRLSGIDLLDNPDQKSAFRALPERFPFKLAKSTYGREDQATLDFLMKGIGLNILVKPEKGWYEKTKGQEEPGTTEPVQAAA